MESSQNHLQRSPLLQIDYTIVTSHPSWVNTYSINILGLELWCRHLSNDVPMYLFLKIKRNLNSNSEKFLHNKSMKLCHLSKHTEGLLCQQPHQEATSSSVQVLAYNCGHTLVRQQFATARGPTGSPSSRTHQESCPEFWL